MLWSEGVANLSASVLYCNTEVCQGVPVYKGFYIQTDIATTGDPSEPKRQWTQHFNPQNMNLLLMRKNPLVICLGLMKN